VSSISYFGIEYFLVKQPEKECKDLNECILKEMPTPISEEETPFQITPNNIDSNLNFNVNSICFSDITLKLLMITFILYNYNLFIL
jgi:predicted membrane GTPase involved in stress response